jgi:predicted nucleotidyltransferase
MLQKSNIDKVAEVFFKEPLQDHYLKEISKKANLAHTSVKNYLEDLKREAVIKESIQKRGSRNFPIYKANRNSGNYKIEKRNYNRHNPSFYDLLNYISTNIMPQTIILFGSYNKGEDDEESDIDIFLQCKKQKIDLSQYEKELHRKIQLHMYNNFKKVPKELKNNIINGTVLRGFLEVF